MIAPEMKTPPADSNAPVTSKYTEAYNLNVRICVNAQMAQQNLYEVCKGLKEMRDGKLYKELGYQNFENYTENEVGIKRRQAHNFIKIAESFGENVQTFAHFGTSKLALLCNLSEEDRTELTETTDLESVSVRELKAKIDDLKKTNDRLMQKNSDAEENARKSQEKESEAWGKVSILRTDTEMQKQKILQLESEIKAKNDSISALEEQVEELENRPIEVAVSESDSREIQNLKDAMKRVDLDWAQKYNEMEDENVKLRRADFQKHAAEIESLKKEYEEKLASIPQPEAIPDTKEVFKAYLANAVDAANRLLGFITKHNDELFVSKAKEFFNTVTNKLEV